MFVLKHVTYILTYFKPFTSTHSKQTAVSFSCVAHDFYPVFCPAIVKFIFVLVFLGVPSSYLSAWKITPYDDFGNL